jgi:hypothetical protein
MHDPKRAWPFGLAATVLVLSTLTGCSDSDKSEKEDSTPGSSSGNNGSSCSGEVTACSLGSLDDAQFSNVCSLMLTSIDAPAGTKYECKEPGPHQTVALTVNTKEQCVQQRPPKTCSVTVAKLIDCYKAAKNDACEAFDGACSFLFDKSTGCVP